MLTVDMPLSRHPKGTLRRWISAHPVAAYFALAYLIAWPLMLLVLVVFPHSMAFQGTLGSLAVFAPAIACMIVAGLAEPARVGKNRRAHWAVFVTTWILAGTTLVLFATRVRTAPMSGPLIVFGALLALLPAFTASRAFSRVAGIRRHFRSLVVPRGNVFWYVLAVLAFPAVQIAGVFIARALGNDAGSASDFEITVDPASAVFLFLHGFFFAGGISEETGWRGFALRRLQRQNCPLAAALIVWVLWALWHLPMDLASGDPASAILINRGFHNALWSVLFMWVFNRTKGSVLAPALFHPAMNTSGTLLPRTDAATALFTLLVVGAVVMDRMWRKLPSTHPALGFGNSGLESREAAV
jgi:membrane protease YdiL (CAAX protease family)